MQPTSDAIGEARFGLLETIRMHALDQLESAGEAKAAQRRHAQSFLRLAEEAEPHIVSADRVPWLHRLDQEFGNLRAALNWALSADGDAELGRRLVGSLSWFWYLRGYLQEGRMWAQRLLAADSTAAPTPGRARVLFAMGGIELMLQGDAAAARISLAESAGLFRAHDDRRRLAYALVLLGMATTSRREPALALTIYAEAAELARAEGDEWLEAFALANQGAAIELVDDLTTAEALYRASLALFSGLNDAWGRGLALRELGGLAATRGEYRAARAVYAESVALFRESGDARGLAQALLGLGRSALQDGAAAEAQMMFSEALARWRDLGIKVGMVRSIAGLGGVAVLQGRFEDAARMYAAATTQARGAGILYALGDSVELEQTVDYVRRQLEPARFAAAWAAGEALSADQIISAALQPIAADT